MAMHVNYNGRDYLMYEDNRDLAADFLAGMVAPGDQIIYRNFLCEVCDKFTDEDGMEFCQLIIMGRIGFV